MLIKMRYLDFEDAFSSDRMSKYVTACNGDTRKAMTLYRYNLQLSQELFTVVSCFEVTLRNRIDNQLKARLGNDWLRDIILPGGVFYSDIRVDKTRKIIDNAYRELVRKQNYSHSQLLAKMEFGIWKYLYSNVHYALTGQVLLRVFPNKPRSTRTLHYDNSYMFAALDSVNNLRNRIAHHEPVCFNKTTGAIDTSYALTMYARIMTLFQWMGIDSGSLLFGLDHVGQVCNKIMCL